MTTPAPRWDLTNVYPSLESKEFQNAVKKYKKQLSELETFIAKKMLKTNPKTDAKKLGKVLGETVDRFNEIFILSGTIGAYISSFVTTDSHNQTAARIQSELEQTNVKLSKIATQFRAWIGDLGGKLDKAVKTNPAAQAHAFTLIETRDQAKHMMSQPEEILASELTLSGGRAFGKLQSKVISQLTVEFELDGKMQKLPMPALINLRAHPDEDTRRRAYEAENKAWDGTKETLAACLNGVKGETNTLLKKRGHKDALEIAIEAARMDRKTLNAMLGAMQDSFPMFRKYFQSKAKKIGKEKLAWWDLFAPVGNTNKNYTFDEARGFILSNFGKFSPELQGLAATAFERNWIDAEQREGKRGGAFHMGVPGVKESRILANYDGSFDGVSTLAHELGHAFHYYCAFKAGKTELQQDTPMTLSETASILCETIITEAVLAQTNDPQERLPVLDAQLNNASEVIVDIYSRFLFEKEIFDRRMKSELSADDFSEIMIRAQQATYGDGLDERYLQKFMWTWKPHYYSSGRPFYNFPYSFGLLFGTGLYAIYEQRGANFVPDYMNLLASTGEDTGARLAKRFGIDITKRKFWDDSLAIIGKRVDQYCEI